MDQKTRQGSQTSMAFPSRQRIEAERDISRLNGSLERPKRASEAQDFLHPSSASSALGSTFSAVFPTRESR